MTAAPRPFAGWRRPVLLGIGASALFLYLTLRRVDFSALVEELAGVSLPILALALIPRGLAFLALGFRSRATVGPGKRLPFGTLVRSHLLGYTGNAVLPLRLGELMRIDYLARVGGLSRSFLVGTVAVERLLDSLLLLALFAATAPVFLGRATFSGSFPALAGMAVLALAVGVVAVRWRGLAHLVPKVLRPLGPDLADRLGGYASSMVRGLTSLSHAQWTPTAVVGTVLYWCTALASVRIVMAAFDLELPWYAPLVVVAITALGTALPSSTAFVGTYHYFSALAISLLGVDRTTSASFAIVVHAVAFLPYTLVGIVVFAGSIRVWEREGVPVDLDAEAEGDPGRSERNP